MNDILAILSVICQNTSTISWQCHLHLRFYPLKLTQLIVIPLYLFFSVYYLPFCSLLHSLHRWQHIFCPLFHQFHHCLSFIPYCFVLLSIAVWNNILDGSWRTVFYPICEAFVGNFYIIELLTFLNFNKDFVWFSILSNFLRFPPFTFGQMYPCLTPSLFIEM